MADIRTALDALLAVQRHRVELTVPNLAALGDLLTQPLRGVQVELVPGKPATARYPAVPERVVVAYPVTAPCRLAQLQDAVGVGSERAGGQGSGGSRPLIAGDAFDLWCEIKTSASAWAVAVGLDRSKYLRRLVVPKPRTAEQAHAPVRAFATVGVPPVGRLLRVAATEADRLGHAAMVDTMARLTGRWAGQIDGVLGRPETKPIRGVPCPDCEVDTVTEDRPVGDLVERYRVPALVLAHGWEDGVRRPYRWCRACGSWAWVDIEEDAA